MGEVRRDIDHAGPDVAGPAGSFATATLKHLKAPFSRRET